MHVFGHEHYAENLEDLACAGVPIRHPISGVTLGAVDLTCWRRDADRLLITLARTTADQITQALLADSNAREFELLQEYLRACRRSAGIVLALNKEVVMMNEQARQVLDPADQVVLLAQATDVLASRHPVPVVIDLPTGAKARMYCRPVSGGDRLAGGVVHIKMVEPGAGRAAGEYRAAEAADVPARPGRFRAAVAARMPAGGRGVHGGGVARAGRRAGAGKLALLRAVHQRRDPAGRFHVLDAADAVDAEWQVTTRSELLEGTGCLVIRHADRLTARRLHALSAALQETMAAGRQESLWIAVTLSKRPAAGGLADLLRFFPSTVELPPLRHHIEDLHELVPFFIAKLNQYPRLVCSPEAMQLLLRSSWPGNTEQLWQVLRKVVQHRRTGLITPGDLPPECWTVSRRAAQPARIDGARRDRAEPAGL